MGVAASATGRDVGAFSLTAGVEAALGRIFGLPEVLFPFPENDSKSLLDDDDDEHDLWF